MARYGHTSQSCRRPLLELLIVQTPKELGGLTQVRGSLVALDKNGHRPACWSESCLEPVETTGKTRWPNHSLTKLPVGGSLSGKSFERFATVRSTEKRSLSTP